MTRAALLLIVVGVLLLWASLSARSRLAFTGLVVGVADGDTITVLRDNQPVRIRLEEIDAPERRQAFGDQAKQHLSSLVFRRRVQVQPVTTDRYGRTVARVRVGGVDVSFAMVEAGLAWQYRRYSHSGALQHAEQQARAARRGLWADAAPVAPWDWRR